MAILQLIGCNICLGDKSSVHFLNDLSSCSVVIVQQFKQPPAVYITERALHSHDTKIKFYSQAFGWVIITLLTFICWKYLLLSIAPFENKALRLLLHIFEIKYSSCGAEVSFSEHFICCGVPLCSYVMSFMSGECPTMCPAATPTLACNVSSYLFKADLSL